MVAKKPAAKGAKPVEAPKPSLGDNLDGLGWAGHAIPAALGLLSLVAAFYAYRSGIQITLAIALIAIAGLLPWLSWLSLNRSRAAWSFLIALCIVLGVMTLFGAPKVRNLVGINLGVAVIIPLLFGFAVFGLIVQEHRYKNQG